MTGIGRRIGKRGFGLLQVRELRAIALLVIVVGGTSLIQPRYLNPNSMRSILIWIPLVAIIGMGEMMVIIIRGIDVSVGSIVGLAGLTVGMLFRDAGISVPLAVVISILIGLALGSLNGAIISKAHVPGVIVTLGGLSAYRGVTFLITRGSQIDGNYIPKSLIRWSQTGPFGIREVPWIVVIVLVIALVTWVIFHYTRLGRDMYALGSNPEAARLRGVAVQRVTFFAYAFTGALAGLAGILYSSRFGFLNPGQTGVGMEMTVIAAVVIGGVSPFGGSGSVLGVLLGCLLLGAVNVALAVLGIAGAWQLAVYGAVILLAVGSDAIFQVGLHRADRSE
jgi:rhamnose transport system permease protein